MGIFLLLLLLLLPTKLSCWKPHAVSRVPDETLTTGNNIRLAIIPVSSRVQTL